MRRRRNRPIRLPVRRFHRRWDQVILEVRRQEIAVLIIGQLLVHRRSQALCQPTVYLPLYDHWINDGATIINRDKAANLDLTGAAINIHNTDIGPKRIGQIGWVIIVDRFKARLKVWRAIGIGGKSQLLNGLTLARSAFDIEATRLPLQVFFTYL